MNSTPGVVFFSV